MMGINICLLMGLPAVGKTTLANKLKLYLSKEDAKAHVIIISYDAFIPENIEFAANRSIYSDSSNLNDTSWKGYRKKVFEFVKELIYIIKNRVNSFEKSFLLDSTQYTDTSLCACFTCKSMALEDANHLIVVDDNMFYRSMRYAFYQLARTFECSYCQVYLDCNIEMTLQRNRVRNLQNVTEETILKMSELIEKPDKIKYKWEENSLVLHCIREWSENELKDLVEFINHSSNYVAPSYEEVDEETKKRDRKICIENLLHQSDQVLRKYISKKMSIEKGNNKSKSILQNLGRMFNESRKRYLQRVKLSQESDINSYVAVGLLTKEYEKKLIDDFEDFLAIDSNNTDITYVLHE